MKESAGIQYQAMDMMPDPLRHTSLFNSIRFKLSLIAAIPLFFAFFLTVRWVGISYDTYSKMNDFHQLVKMSSYANAYVHEVQKERGVTSIYLGSGGGRFFDRMIDQRESTDAARSEFRNYLKSYDSRVFNERFERDLAVAMEEMRKLNDCRIGVDTLSISAGDSIKLYSDHNAAVNQVVMVLTKQSNDAESTVMAGAFENFLHGKELAGIERAMWCKVFAADYFNPGYMQQLASLIAAQQTRFARFLELATPEQAALYKEVLHHPASVDVQQMRDNAFIMGEASKGSRLWIQLLDEFGYGGMIHNYKNYIIRGETKYAEYFEENHNRASRILAELIETVDEEDEIAAYTVTKSMLDGYKRGIDVARAAFETGKTTAEVDQLVRFDDAPALEALTQLSKSIGSGSLSVDVDYCFDTTTKRINLLKKVEERLVADLVSKSSSMATSARSSFLLLSLFATIVTITVLTVVVVIGNRIIRPIIHLSNAATLVAQGDLSQVVENEFHDEIGNLTRCFNGMVCSIRELFLSMEKQAHDLEQAKTAAEAADQSKSEFLANMSHEIRTPMTAILGFTETIAENIKDPANIDAIQIVQRNGEYLLNIINDILDLSKIDSGKMTTESVKFNPIGLVADVVDLIETRAKSKGLALEVEYIGEMPETIQSDPTRLRQILINLIGNAIKFTEEGGVRLITRMIESDGTTSLQFDVLDTGIGMSHEQVTGLFQPFTQADTSITRKFGGTGLGLTISKHFAEMLGGDITIPESKSGVGTRFRAIVATGSIEGVKMISNPSSDEIKRVSKGSDVIRVNLNNHRILYAEDGPDNQKLVSFVLKKAGATVVIMENGKLALDAALAARVEGNPFDCILMDMQMPVMSGYEATTKLRQAGYAGPIIALTAHAMEGDREKCIASGCDEFANKPIDRKKLIELIASFSDRDAQAA